MFVPRALRLKGVREPSRPKKPAKPAKSPAKPQQEDSIKDGLVEAMGDASINLPASQQEQPAEPAKPSPNPNSSTPASVTPEFIAQLAAGIELIFTDYAHYEEKRARWLQERYRVVDGQDKFVHLTAILQHPNIAGLKPAATQILLQQALHCHPSKILEVSENSYYVRRKPSSNPLPFVPPNSFDVVNDDGLAFWDQRTIYVEPHIRNLCQTPARVAHWLAEHGELKPKWLPIQAVHTLWNGCAFVVLSGNVMHADVWQNWRDTSKPDDWKVMTKVEHTRRTVEYVKLLQHENPRGMRKNMPSLSDLPAIERPAVLSKAVEMSLQTDAAEQPKAKRKRKRRKGEKSGTQTDDADANMNTFAPDDADDEPSKKRRA